MNKSLLLAVALSGAVVAMPSMANEALAKSKNCFACHSVTTKLVGPAYKDVAAKYAGDAEAVGKLATSIAKGSAGKWGPIPMPQNGVTEAEAKALAKWVLSLK